MPGVDPSAVDGLARPHRAARAGTSLPAGSIRPRRRPSPGSPPGRCVGSRRAQIDRVDRAPGSPRRRGPRAATGSPASRCAPRTCGPATCSLRSRAPGCTAPRSARGGAAAGARRSSPIPPAHACCATPTCSAGRVRCWCRRPARAVSAAVARASIYGDPSRAAGGGRDHRHLRQDHDLLPAGGRARRGRLDDRAGRHRADADRRPGRAQRADHPGGTRPAGAVRGDGRAGRPGGRDGGFLARARPAPGQRNRLRGRCFHQPEPGPPGLPPRHGELLRGQGHAVRRPRRAGM